MCYFVDKVIEIYFAKGANEMSENSFGQIVKRERKKMKMSLAKVAEAVTNIDNDHKINPSYINRLEKGEQSNPSFIIVAMLSTVLDLDMREVFRTFGFEKLIGGYDSEAKFTLTELIRLHTLKPGEETINENETSMIRHLNNNEKEALIKLLEAVFNYTSEKYDPPIDKLIPVLEELDKLRQIQKRELNKQETFEFNYMGETFTIELGSLLKREGIRLGELKENIKVTIKEEFNKLMDFPSGILKVKVGKEKWLIQKERYKLTLLSKQPEVEL